MGINIGQQLESYEITALLGKGGMGEVYRARDTKLNRDVAIKVLPDEFSCDAERVDRFQREAEVLASLNHPNIAAIYDLEQAQGSRFLVLELVEGETLADRLQRGPLPVEEALEIAKHISEALEAVHERGIIHRDLKPANIKLTPNGKVKVLDFGLAKGNQERQSPNLSDSPTLMNASVPGLIIGTAAYMSPEQAKGQTVDKRTDIWAFGVVLYEMLTGRRLFEGESASESLAAVLTKEPEWDRVPRKVRRLLQRCLEKDPKLRLRDIGDAWQLIELVPEAPAKKTAVPWIVATLVTVGAVLALWNQGRWHEMRSVEAPPQAVIRLDVDLGPDVSIGSDGGPSTIISPDGTRLVFVSRGSDGTPRLLTRLLDESKAALLPGSEGAYAPFFSPDGLWVGFFASGKLKKTRLDGGQPIALCDAPAGRGASWSEDGTVIAALDIRGGLSQIAADSGKAASVTEREPAELSHRWPQVLPGGKAVLFTVGSAPNNYEDASIAVVSLKDRQKRILLEHAGMFPRYLPSGHIIYSTKGTVFAVRFDLARLEISGAASPVLENVWSDANYGFAQLDSSRSGTILYHKGGAQGSKIIQWLDGAGKTESVRAEPGNYQMPRVSPDGGRLALSVIEGSDASIWVYDIRGARTRLTVGPGVNTDPVWSPDGRYVVFQASGGGLSWTPADGADKPKPLTKSQRLQFPTSFAPDASRLAFFELEPGGGTLIKTVPLRQDSGQPVAGEAELFLKTPTTGPYPAFSPDGRWLAYSSADSGVYEVYVRAFPDKGTKWQISTTGGNLPAWSRKGKELFYRTEDHRIMVATYTVKGDSFVADTPRVWSQKQLANTGLTGNLDLAPNGKRFAVLIAADSPEPQETRSHITLVLNFFDEVRRRLAATKK